MDNLLIAGIGEVLWDVIGDSEKLGGAPVNFAFHSNSLGARGIPISVVGDDDRGSLAIEVLSGAGVITEHISVIVGATTGYVLAEVDSAGVANYNFPDEVAWDQMIIKPSTRELAKSLDAVCFGSLAQRTSGAKEVICEFLEGLGNDTLKVFDLNLRQNFYSKKLIIDSLVLTDVLKLNDEELDVIADLLVLEGDNQSRLQHLVELYDLKLAALTCGSKGSLLVSRDAVSVYAGKTVNVVDTIGAGDAFTAATVIGLLNEMGLDEINRQANKVAAYICSQKGAMVPFPKDLHWD